MRKSNVFALACLVFTAVLAGCGSRTDSSTALTKYSISGTITTNGSGLEGVTVILNSSSTATTDANGHYSFSGLENGNYTITPSMAGYSVTPTVRSVNINSADITAQNFVASWVYSGGLEIVVLFNQTHSISGTVTANGSGLEGVTVTLNSSSTATTDSNGYYSFWGLENGNYTITPSKAGYTFTPTSLTVTVDGGDISGQDFCRGPVMYFTDKTAFLTAASGTLTTIGFDLDSNGNPIAANSPGVLAGSLFSGYGITFSAGVVFGDPNLTFYGSTPPNIITNTAINTPTTALVDASFTSAVHEVGITNVGATAVLRIFDASNVLIAGITSDSDTSTKDFVGLISDTPIYRIEYDYVSGIGFEADDLVFTRIGP